MRLVKLLLLVLMKAGRLPVTLLELGLLGMLLLKLSTEETESRQVRRTPGIVIVIQSRLGCKDEEPVRSSLVLLLIIRHIK